MQGKPPRNHDFFNFNFLFLGGALNYCPVCPLCTWVAQLGSIPVLWGGYTLVPWSLPHLLPYAPVQVTRQDELHQLATDRENSNLSWLPDIVLLQQLEILRFLVPTVTCSFWMSLSLYEEPQSPDLVKTAATEVRKSFSFFGTSCIIANVVAAAALWNQMFMVAFWGFGFSLSRTFVTALLNLFLTSKTAVLSSYRKIWFFFLYYQKKHPKVNLIVDFQKPVCSGDF